MRRKSAGAVTDIVLFTGGTGAIALGTLFLGGFGGSIVGDLAYNRITYNKNDWMNILGNAAIAGVFNVVSVGYPQETKSYREIYGSFKKYFNDFLTWWVDGDGARLAQTVAVSIFGMGTDSIIDALTPQIGSSGGNSVILVGGGCNLGSWSMSYV